MKLSIFTPLVLALLFLNPFAQSKDFSLTASPAVPAAKGKVDVDKDQNGNRKVKLEVQHLAKPTP